MLPIFILGGIGYFWYNQNFGTEDYYTKITQKGEHRYIGMGDGMKQYRYTYTLPSYKENDEEKTITFDSFEDKQLKENAYLVLHVNDKKGVVGWEEVATSEVPQNVRKSLDN